MERDAQSRPECVIDGSRIDDLDGFYTEVSRALIPGADWGRNLDAFNDILRGGFGTPDGGFVLRWRNFERSRRLLGHAETARWLRKVLAHCHPSNRTRVEERIIDAEAGRGETLFEIVVEIIRSHGPGGVEEQDGVELVLD